MRKWQKVYGKEFFQSIYRWSLRHLNNAHTSHLHTCRVYREKIVFIKHETKIQINHIFIDYLLVVEQLHLNHVHRLCFWHWLRRSMLIFASLFANYEIINKISSFDPHLVLEGVVQYKDKTMTDLRQSKANLGYRGVWLTIWWVAPDSSALTQLWSPCAQLRATVRSTISHCEYLKLTFSQLQLEAASSALFWAHHFPQKLVWASTSGPKLYYLKKQSRRNTGYFFGI